LVGRILNTSLKQRLVGATVLVALGVIFIPMLLERRSEEGRLSVQMEIPDKPDIEFQDRLDAGRNAVEEIEWPENVQESSQPAREEIPWSAPTAEAPVPKTVTADPPQPAKDPVVNKPADKPVQPISKPVAKPVPVATQQWIVQLGSFSQRKNAEGLQDKLRDDGHKAFVEAAGTAAGQVYRVRIGPLENRVQAEGLVSQLKKNKDYRPIIMGYP
jgi:DedD protein